MKWPCFFWCFKSFCIFAVQNEKDNFRVFPADAFSSGCQSWGPELGCRFRLTSCLCEPQINASHYHGIHFHAHQPAILIRPWLPRIANKKLCIYYVYSMYSKNKRPPWPGLSFDFCLPQLDSLRAMTLCHRCKYLWHN